MNGMKRQAGREASPKGKRSRSSISRYGDVERDTMSPDRPVGGSSRREPRSATTKSPSDEHGRSGGSSKYDYPRDRGVTRGDRGSTGGRSYRDDGDEYRTKPPERTNGYKVLCVSNIYHKPADADVKDSLYRQFKKYGEVSIKIFHDSNDRIAYIYFPCYEDAREARHAKSRMTLFERPVTLEPVAASDLNRKSRRSASPDFGYGRVVGSSPSHSSTGSNNTSRRLGRHPSIERGIGPPLPPHPQYRDLHVRKDFLPPEYAPPHYHHPSERRYDQPKKEKFPNYLHHVPPEEDDKATRTLFIGNLEVTITEPDLRRIFERYGVVEDIDVKRPPPGQGNAYAFVKFLNLDMAHRAKVEMSGQYIGKFQCKIGYGKANPTTRLWVGGLGSWTSLSHLEREFDRFGAIRKIDFVKGENHAYILYDSIDAAQAACQEMRGFPLGGPERRLRVDFADTSPFNYQMQQSPTRTSSGSYRGQPEDHSVPGDPYITPPHISRSRLPPVDDRFFAPPVHGDHWDAPYSFDAYERDHGSSRREPWSGPERDYGRNWGSTHDIGWRGEYYDSKNSSGERRKRQQSPGYERHDSYYAKRPRSRTPDRSRDDQGRTVSSNNRPPHSPSRDFSKSKRDNSLRDKSPVNGSDRTRRHSLNDDRPAKATNNIEIQDHESNEESVSKETNLAAAVVREGCIGGLDVAENVSNLQELAKCFPVTWHGGLVLKNSSFATRMHLCSGDVSLVDSLMKEKTSDIFSLRITQRLRLDKPKLDDVARRITSSGPSGHYCMMLALPGMATASNQTQGEENSIQQRPLRNLVTYLKQKEAAGVIALSSNNVKDSKDSCGVLYAFPPCDFSLTLLRCIASKIKEDSCKEQDHLTVIVVRGAS